MPALKQLITPEKAIELLQRVGCSFSVIRHCEAVSKLAVELAMKLSRKGFRVDVELIRIGGLLHDIGRSKTHKIDHAVVGSEILRSSGIPSSIIRIVERHIGSGISADEAVRLGLPNKSYVPQTLEEKIVSYADKLIEGNREISFDEALKSFVVDFGEFHPMVDRFRRVHQELNQKL